MTPASAAPAVAISNATALATNYLGTSDQTTSPQADYGTLTIRDDQGQVAWGIAARPVWLVTFHGVAYPSALGPQDCSCQANYWRPNTVVAVDATTGIPVIKLGVTS
jgi:RES domain-containing protein